eukprot:GILJ01017091.1.p1 GENE.GILJ01017091.1~~GILJ01017091.1.p1  ORF type:complete len:193 (+),score=15.55 GILJ01017091.1:252-830(+)
MHCTPTNGNFMWYGLCRIVNVKTEQVVDWLRHSSRLTVVDVTCNTSKDTIFTVFAKLHVPSGEPSYLEVELCDGVVGPSSIRFHSLLESYLDLLVEREVEIILSLETPFCSIPMNRAVPNTLSLYATHRRTMKQSLTIIDDYYGQQTREAVAILRSRFPLIDREHADRRRELDRLLRAQVVAEQMIQMIMND